MNIEMVPVQDAQSIWEELLNGAPIAAAILFGGDRWEPVEVVFTARDEDGKLIGLASLSPHTEAGDASEAEMIGAWVHPEHQRRGIGWQLVERVARYAQEVWDKPLLINGVTMEGKKLAEYAALRGTQLGLRIRAIGGGLISLQ